MEATRDQLERARQAGRREGAARTIAQTFCVIVGIALIAAGILGFIFGESSFDTGDAIAGEEFLGLEVNGWHNVVHIATGALLLLAAPGAASAAIAALLFGIAYAAVAVWGFADETILEAIVINDADNWLHVALAAAGILAGLASGALGLAGRREAKAAYAETPEREVARPAASDTSARPADTTTGDPNVPSMSTDPRTRTDVDPDQVPPREGDIPESERRREP